MKLEDLVSKKNRILLNDLVEGDISAYIHAKVRESEELKRWWHILDVQNEIDETIAKKVNGV